MKQLQQKYISQVRNLKKTDLQKNKVKNYIWDVS